MNEECELRRQRGGERVRWRRHRVEHDSRGVARARARIAAAAAWGTAADGHIRASTMPPARLYVHTCTPCPTEYKIYLILLLCCTYNSRHHHCRTRARTMILLFYFHVVVVCCAAVDDDVVVVTAAMYNHPRPTHTHTHT